ncbi:TetR/AcrR family transcriptional regulator [Frigoribacterium sp. CFBP 8759]|uniref:TetR/AcrR family transcriptional regulator n=1 Tax=Frigoribacterium sp. CFBP 8759 TaxID=2775283 RepID=UPI001781B178|nr:TetR/AcrR family transcriptional regulator [Frigoribacterium sp. CFBP 8759]MBD8484384.1 TetR/AcrR family transcriptional regulator [Frigoribacterium sp. CFBP 8759]
MPRKPDPTRKPELLGQILEHLRGRSLATVSFRTLAEALGVSTYVFVYHFGNRAELIAEIVRAVVARNDALLSVAVSELDREAFGKHLTKVWHEVTTERGRDLHRLELEAALLETVAGEVGGTARGAVGRWVDHVAGWVSANGVAPAEAKVAARVFVDALFGLQYDAIVSGDGRRASAAYKHAVETLVSRVPQH